LVAMRSSSLSFPFFSSVLLFFFCSCSSCGSVGYKDRGGNFWERGGGGESESCLFEKFFFVVFLSSFLRVCGGLLACLCRPSGGLARALSHNGISPSTGEKKDIFIFIASSSLLRHSSSLLLRAEQQSLSFSLFGVWRGAAVAVEAVVVVVAAARSRGRRCFFVP